MTARSVGVGMNRSCTIAGCRGDCGICPPPDPGVPERKDKVRWVVTAVCQWDPSIRNHAAGPFRFRRAAERWQRDLSNGSILNEYVIERIAVRP